MTIAVARTCAPSRQIALQSPAGQRMADTSISGARLARELDALVRVYGKPACIVSDNGTEFTRRAILKWAGDNGVDWHCIDPGKPQQSGFIESFNGSLRRSRARKHALPGNGRAAERGNLRYVRRCPPQTGPLAIRLQQPLSGHCCAMPREGKGQTALISGQPNTR